MKRPIVIGLEVHLQLNNPAVPLAVTISMPFFSPSTS